MNDIRSISNNKDNNEYGELYFFQEMYSKYLDSTCVRIFPLNGGMSLLECLLQCSLLRFVNIQVSVKGNHRGGVLLVDSQKSMFVLSQLLR